MPTTFDFADGASSTASYFPSPASISTIISNVTFTMSVAATNGLASMSIGGTGNFPLSFSDSARSGGSGNETFNLALAKSATPSLNQLSGTGTGASMVKIQLMGNNNLGSWRVEFTKGGTGTVALTGAISDNQTFSAAGQFTGIRFTSLSAGHEAMVIQSITLNDMVIW